MNDAKLITALQRQAAEAEVERLRLVGELEEMRLRAAQAESMLASVSGVTRLELVAAERAKRDGLLAALRDLRGRLAGTSIEADDAIDASGAEAAIAAAEAAP